MPATFKCDGVDCGATLPLKGAHFLVSRYGDPEDAPAQAHVCSAACFASIYEATP